MRRVAAVALVAALILVSGKTRRSQPCVSNASGQLRTCVAHAARSDPTCARPGRGLQNMPLVWEQWECRGYGGRAADREGE